MKRVDEQWMADGEAARCAGLMATRTADHHEPHPDGSQQGRDPRTMGAADLEACGLERLSRGDAIRAKCLDCVGTMPEVRRCAMIECSLWPFRMGSDPWRAPMSDAQRAAAAQRLHSGRQPKQP